MKDTTKATTETAIETFLTLVKKDSEMYSFPEEYFKSYLVAALKNICKNEAGAMQYIQIASKLMEQDHARQGR